MGCTVVNDDGGVGAVPARLVVVRDGIRRRPLWDTQRLHRGKDRGVEVVAVEVAVEDEVEAARLRSRTSGDSR